MPDAYVYMISDEVDDKEFSYFMYYDHVDNDCGLYNMMKISL